MIFSSIIQSVCEMWWNMSADFGVPLSLPVCNIDRQCRNNDDSGDEWLSLPLSRNDGWIVVAHVKFVWHEHIHTKFSN